MSPHKNTIHLKINHDFEIIVMARTYDDLAIRKMTTVATPVKQWIQEHVDFYVTCAIVKESIDNRDEQKTAYLYTDLKTVDYEKGYTAFDAVNDVISRQTGTGLEEADYQRISYVNDINRSNEEVLYETIAGGNRANGSFAYRYGIQRESYSYEAAATTAGSRAFDSLSISQSGSYYYDGYGSVSNLSAGEDSISYTYDAYGNMQKTGTYGEISTDSSAYGNPYGYNGEYSHALTGLQYLRARYYQASTGSFISKDSYAGNIRSILRANRYTYGENNPLGYADPSGHSVLSKIKSAVNTVVTGVKQSASKAWNRVKENASQIKNTVVNTVKTVGTALKNVNSERKSGETTSQWKNRVAQEKAAKSGAKADLISPDGLANMAKVGVAAINPITSLSTCASGLLLSGIDEFRNSYRDYMFRKVDGAIGNSAYGEQYYKAKAFVYELEKKACAAYEACQNLPQTLIKLALPKSAPDRILHGVDLIKNGKFKARGGILLGIAGVLFAGTGIGAAGVVAGLYTAGGGISQIAEGVQEVYYGIKGDTETEVKNVYSKYIYDDYYGCYDGSLEISASCGYSAFVEGLLGGAGLKNAGSGSGNYSAFGEMSEADGVRYRDWNYEKIQEISIHNPNADSMTLGKYFDGTIESGSYVARAELTGDTYFSLGTQWNDIAQAYGLSDKEMFNLFNTRALDNAVMQGKTIRFSQNPLDWVGTALGDEWSYLQHNYGYRDLIEMGGYWYAVK